MKKIDIKRRIHLNNQDVLKTNEVFNSVFADEKLKLAIRTRSLQGMSQEEFENAYKQVLYGISDKTFEVSPMIKADPWAEKKRKIIPPKDEVEANVGQVLHELNQDKTENTTEKVENPETAPATTTAAATNALVKQSIDATFDMVPISIDQFTLAKSGHKESYLLRICRENQITMRQLHVMIEYKLEYKTTLNTILSLMKRGFDLDEIQCFYEAREQLSSDDEKTENISLIMIVNFQERFEGMPIDADHLANTIRETFDTLADRHVWSDYDYYIGTAIKNVIQVADELDTPFLEVALDWIEGVVSYAS
ncbi:hypothetical protein ACFL2U_03595 [Patescibacteria group bacterium]